MGALFRSAFSFDALKTAWREVQLSATKDGETASLSVARFAVDAEAELARLADRLATGEYSPATLAELQIVIGEKKRTLHVPPVRDRIVARALLRAITPLIDPHLGPASYAYRPGLGVADAIQQVVAWRSSGHPWVARTDIHDCFPNIPAELSLRRATTLIGDDDVTQTLARFIHRRHRTSRDALRTLSGLPQGCPLSPLLANLVLVDLDDALLSDGFPVVRYADDLCVAAASQADAQEALRIASHAAKELTMELGTDKTAIMSFEEGFTFLGEDFGPRYPPELGEHRVIEPDQKVVYAGVQGSRVRVTRGRLLLTSKDDSTLLDIPTSQVCRVVCFGSVGVSAGARSWAFANDVDLVFASRSGSYQGSLCSDGDVTRPARVRAQFAAADNGRGTAIARRIVAAKIAKQRVLLQRANRRETREQVADAVHQLDQLHRMVDQAGEPAELMGLEGAAARFYFPCFGSLLPEALQFVERSRRPPMDVANAALSYLYTILLGECVTALRAAGLDPAIGVLHSEADKRPSLALDLMEEFRPLVVDQVVLRAAQASSLGPSHGRTEPGRGVLLTKAGKEAITGAYERRMLQRTSALPDFSGTIRRHLYRQAQRLRAAIMSADIEWTGLSWR